MVVKQKYTHVCIFFSDLLRYSIFSCQYSKLSTHVLSKPNRKDHKASSFLVYCNSQITKNGRNGNIEEAESIFNRMSSRNTISWTAMLTAYAENGKITKARKLFDEMPDRTTASYNAMITGYIRNNRNVDEAYGLFCELIEKNPVSFAAMITGFVQAKMFDKAKDLYAEMPADWRDPVCSNALISGYLKMGRLEDAVRVFDHMVERDVVSWTSMVDGYCKIGRIVDASGLFRRMPERNVVTWTAMINGYFKVGFFENGFGLFLSMRQEGLVRVNSTTLTVMFDACGNFGRFREGIQVHALVVRMGYEQDLFLRNSIITMYCRFGCTNVAKVFFQMMCIRDVISWNSLIAGYIQCHEIEEAYELFQKMPRKDIVSWTTMITGFSRLGNVDRCIELFGMMPEKDDIAWTAVISGLVSNEEQEVAFHWFIEMLRKAVRPNPVTFSILLSASAGLATLSLGQQIQAQVLKIDMEFEVSIQNSLVSLYSKCGNVDDAYQVFTSIIEPNVVSFNSMISGFAQNGLGKEALNLFAKMENERQDPNEVTFLAVLSACTHVGLVEVGWKQFKSMKSSYGIEPGPDHYACMVDLLGRAGFLDEATDLISSMPFKSHPGVWGALLGASKTHFRLDLAELAAQKLMELEPDSATPYVVLSHLYSVVGKKKDGDQLRNAKKSRGIRKSPGCSWIVLKDKVHLFLAGDQSHMYLEETKLILQTIANELEEELDV